MDERPHPIPLFTCHPAQEAVGKFGIMLKKHDVMLRSGQCEVGGQESAVPGRGFFILAPGPL